MDRETPELIEQQMQNTRESLTEKVSELEKQVVDKLQSATEAVQETVQSVRSAVEETVASVTGSLKSSVEAVTEALDVRSQVREHPWIMVGGTATAGLVTGLVVFRRSRPAAMLPAPVSAPVAAVALSQPASRPGWLNWLADYAGQELKKIGEQAIATASSSLKEAVVATLPVLIERAVPHLISRSERADESESLHHGNGRASYADSREGKRHSA